MDIEITNFYKQAETEKYFNSIANSGKQNIGEITYNNALNSHYKFVTVANIKAIRDYLNDIGFSEAYDLDPKEINAVFIQLISGEIQEEPRIEFSDRMFCDDDGKVYYSLD